MMLKAAIAELVAATQEASQGLVQREGMAELVVLSAIAREHMLVVGPPGTAKSEVVRRVSRALGGQFFEYLLGRFTEPSEIFGPVDLRKLREGIVETAVSGMLPEAEIAFLDEVFLGSTAILNTLLGILNERVFRRGHTVVECPLRICVGAANAIPEDPALAAFADRFLVHLFVEPIADPHLEDLLTEGWKLSSKSVSGSRKRLQALDAAAGAARKVNLDAVRGPLADAVRILRGEGLELSDRRAVKLQRLVAAAAVLDGREQAQGSDLWPIVFALPTQHAQETARTSLKELLATSRNQTLVHSVEEASLGRLARARRLVEQGSMLLGARPSQDDATDGDNDAANVRHWRLKLEGIAREIDAGFADNQRPDDLNRLRGDIVSALGGG